VTRFRSCVDLLGRRTLVAIQVLGTSSQPTTKRCRCGKLAGTENS